MSDIPSFEHLAPQHADLELRKVDAAFSLAQLHGIEHLVDKSGQQYITYEKGIPYATTEAGHSLGSILLGHVVELEDPADGRQWLMLPDNYVTMAQALNDAIGNRSTEASLTLAHDLFAELGAELAQIAQTDRLAPQHLGHKQVIFLRDSAGVKLVPPLRMVDFEDAEVARERSLTQLWQSCARSVVTQVQMNELMIAFKGFEELFRWS